MSFEEIKEARQRVAAKLNQLENTENTDDVLELTLEELSAISGGAKSGGGVQCIKIGPVEIVCKCKTCYGGGTYP